MPTQAQIQKTILSAKLKSANLTNANLTMLAGGTSSVKWGYIKRIRYFTKAVVRQYNLLDYSSANFLLVYDCLVNLIGLDTTTNTIDPNYNNPNIIINVSFTMPPPVEITYGSMTLSGTRYDNPLWKGLNPFMVVDNTTWLENGVDYSLLSTGGFILSPTGNVPAIYAGQAIRALNYQPMFAGTVYTDTDDVIDDVTVTTYAAMIALGTPINTLRVRVLADENVGGTNTRYVKYSDGTISFDN